MAFKFSNQKLKKEINDLQERYKNLNTTIHSYERTVEYNEDEISKKKEDIDTLQEEVKMLKNEIEEKQNKINSLKKFLPEKEKAFTALKKQLNEKESVLNDEIHDEFKQYILSLKEDDCYITKLYSDTATVDLLDEYCCSEKDFLILKNQFKLNNNWVYASLIVTPNYSFIKSEKTQPTMTELKKNSGKTIDIVSCRRLNPIKQELLKIDQINELEDNQIYTFDTPFLIGGQTSSNRTGYGWEWLGGRAYIEGTLYGEVTRFMIVGFIVNSSYL